MGRGRRKLETAASQLCEADLKEFVQTRDLAPVEPDIPHAEAICFGANPAWSPAREATDPETCRTCGGLHGYITRGSRLVCGACMRSGFDDVAALLLRKFRTPAPGAKGPWEDETLPKRGAIPRERIKQVTSGCRGKLPMWVESPPLD